MSKYQITVSDEQAKLIVAALDLYSRVGAGQFQEVAEVAYPSWDTKDFNRDAKDAAKELLTQAKQMLFPELGGNTAYGTTSQELNVCFKRAYDVQCVIRKVIAQHEKYHSTSIWHNGPLPCDNISLATCEVVEE